MNSRLLEKPLISEEFPDKANLIFELLKVNPEEDKNLRILDQVADENLILVHYIEPNRKNRHIRGIIVDVDQMKVVAKSFPYTEEVPTNQPDETLDISLGEKYEVTKAYEGTIIRVFQGEVGKKWYMSTHRKIDGTRSRWSGPTFGEMFDEIWGTPHKWDDYLVSGNCYIFLLSHGANRLVCEVSTPSLYHLQTFTQVERDMIPTNKALTKIHPNVKQQIRLPLTSIDEIVKEAGLLDWRECSGLLVTNYSAKDGDISECWKIVPDEYNSRRLIRGNEPNFRLRYLQLKKEDSEKSIRELFPEKKDLFDKVEKDLLKLPDFLSEYFVERYYNKRFIYLPRDIHAILKDTSIGFDTSLKVEDNIKRRLEKSDARQINATIRFMLNEQKFN